MNSFKFTSKPVLSFLYKFFPQNIFKIHKKCFLTETFKNIQDLLVFLSDRLKTQQLISLKIKPC